MKKVRDKWEIFTSFLKNSYQMTVDEYIALPWMQRKAIECLFHDYYGFYPPC